MNAPVSTPPPPADLNKLRDWRRQVLAVCLVLFAGELGFCLIVLPWLSNWDMSYIPVHSRRFSGLWMSPYFRGLLSGLGLLNVYVALAEAGRIFRSFFSKPARGNTVQ